MGENPLQHDVITCTLEQLVTSLFDGEIEWHILRVAELNTGRAALVAWHPTSACHFVAPLVANTRCMTWTRCKLLFHSQRDALGSMYADAWVKQVNEESSDAHDLNVDGAKRSSRT